MKLAFSRLWLAAVFTVPVHPLFAQRVTVQQPVVQVFSVDTVVSVPDRGSAYLGGVSTAAEGRGDFGLFPFGSGIGFRQTDAGVDASVSIHDFEAMDAYLLSQPGHRDDSSWVNPNRRAAAAFNSLKSDQSTITRTSRNAPVPGRSRQTVAEGSIPSESAGPPQTDDPRELAAFYLERARVAEQMGKGRVAMLCYRMAARYGSTTPVQRPQSAAGRE